MKSKPIHLTLSACPALIVWILSYPGIFNFDSIQQIAQARSWQFFDWHPPLMAFALAIVLRMGGNVALLTLAAGLLGAWGMRAVLIEALHRLARREIVATAATAVLLLPCFPLVFFFITFIKDAWLTVAFLWLLAFALRQMRQGWTWKASAAIAVLAGLSPSIRHNALIVLPAVSLLLFILHKPALKRQVAFAVLPWLVAATFTVFWWSVGVRRSYIQNWLMDNEIKALCYQWPGRCSPYGRTLKPVTFSKEEGAAIAETPKLWLSYFQSRPELGPEYRQAWRNSPLQMAYIKARTFYGMLNPPAPLQHLSTYPNSFGLYNNPSAWLSWVGHWSSTSRLNRALFWHLPFWLVAHFLLMAAMLRKEWLQAAILLIPVSYYDAYALVATASDWRFMLPATLLIQLLLLGRLIEWLTLRKRNTAHHPAIIDPQLHLSR